MAEPRFDVYKNKGGKWRWKLIGSNGRKVASSGESFASRANAVRAAENVKQRAPKAASPPKRPAGGAGAKKGSPGSLPSQRSASSTTSKPRARRPKALTWSGVRQAPTIGVVRELRTDRWAADVPGGGTGGGSASSTSESG
jgi:uncharacterized protein YegP (UPF0339 family)